MTAEREAMALERELRAHVAGMQCAIDNCGINKKEWNEATKYAMDNIGEWKRLLSEYADYLSRAAEPVAEVKDSDALYDGFIAWRVQNPPPVGTKLYTHPPEPARDAEDAVRYRWMRVHVFDDQDWGQGECNTPEQVDTTIDAAMAQESGNGD
jgi:hypothetical protein